MSKFLISNALYWTNIHKKLLFKVFNLVNIFHKLINPLDKLKDKV